MNAQIKKTLTGTALGVILLPIVAACGGQQTAQAPTTTTQPPSEATTPASPTVQVSPAPGTQAENVADLIEDNPSLRNLASIIDEADLNDALERGGPYTVFAPSDQAFASIPPATRERLLQDENRELLRQILNYHIVPGNLTASQLQSGSVQTQAGNSVNVQGEHVTSLKE